MTEIRKPIPKSQVELSQDSIEPYLNQGKVPVPSNKRRENQRSVKNDTVKPFTVGLSDMDGAILYYFNNVIRPSVIQNSTKINVPVIYGSPEMWASVQKDGHYRDKNGKIQVPLIMVKRDSIEKVRTLGNKMDANNPIHFGVFQKKYSQKNVYDRFSVLTNREPVKEFYGVIMPDYVNLVYSCTIFTEYVEQMNKLVESINFASDSYWGDPERFKFRAAIDSYSTITELVQGQDRTVKTTFQIKLAGYIVPDSINTSVANPNKYYSKASVSFKMETAGTSEILTSRASTPEKQSPTRFFDTALTGVQSSTTSQSSGMTQEQIDWLGLSTTAVSDSIVDPIATFSGRTIVSPPGGFPAIAEEDFTVYLNGSFIPPLNRNTTQSGSNIIITFTGLDIVLDSLDQVVLIGKFI